MAQSDQATLSLLERILISTLPPLATLLLAWLAGQRLSARWSERQKRREFELALANDFYSSYGEFRALWREWNWHCSRSPVPDAESAMTSHPGILERACRVEGGMEAFFLKIAAERKLSELEAAALGNLRQAFQVLRERIQEGVPISYATSDDPDYEGFKKLAAFTGNLLATRPGALPTPAEAETSFLEITNNRHEAPWRSAGR